MPSAPYQLLVLYPDVQPAGAGPNSLMFPAAAPLPRLPALPRSQLRGQDRARDSPGLATLQEATDKEHLRIRRRAELSTSHTSLKKRGRAVCQLLLPILLSSKKSCLETRASSSCEARWPRDTQLARCACVIIHLRRLTPKTEFRHRHFFFVLFDLEPIGPPELLFLFQ